MNEPTLRRTKYCCDLNYKDLHRTLGFTNTARDFDMIETKMINGAEYPIAITEQKCGIIKVIENKDIASLLMHQRCPYRGREDQILPSFLIITYLDKERFTGPPMVYVVPFNSEAQKILREPQWHTPRRHAEFQSYLRGQKLTPSFLNTLSNERKDDYILPRFTFEKPNA